MNDKNLGVPCASYKVFANETVETVAKHRKKRSRVFKPEAASGPLQAAIYDVSMRSMTLSQALVTYSLNYYLFMRTCNEFESFYSTSLASPLVSEGDITDKKLSSITFPVRSTFVTDSLKDFSSCFDLAKTLNWVPEKEDYRPHVHENKSDQSLQDGVVNSDHEDGVVNSDHEDGVVNSDHEDSDEEIQAQSLNLEQSPYHDHQQKDTLRLNCPHPIPAQDQKLSFTRKNEKAMTLLKSKIGKPAVSDRKPLQHPAMDRKIDPYQKLGLVLKENSHARSYIDSLKIAHQRLKQDIDWRSKQSQNNWAFSRSTDTPLNESVPSNMKHNSSTYLREFDIPKKGVSEMSNIVNPRGDSPQRSLENDEIDRPRTTTTSISHTQPKPCKFTNRLTMNEVLISLDIKLESIIRERERDLEKVLIHSEKKKFIYDVHEYVSAVKCASGESFETYEYLLSRRSPMNLVKKNDDLVQDNLFLLLPGEKNWDLLDPVTETNSEHHSMYLSDGWIEDTDSDQETMRKDNEYHLPSYLTATLFPKNKSNYSLAQLRAKQILRNLPYGGAASNKKLHGIIQEWDKFMEKVDYLSQVFRNKVDDAEKLSSWNLMVQAAHGVNIPDDVINRARTRSRGVLDQLNEFEHQRTGTDP